MEPASRISGKAILSLFLGLLSFVTLVFTGVPAILLGFSSVRDINVSDGRLSGKSFAYIGMITGAVGILLCVLGFAAYMILRARETANRFDCQNNLKHIGEALGHYHFKHDRYPAGTIIHENLPPDKRPSWFVSILPYLDIDSAQGRRAGSTANATRKTQNEGEFAHIYSKMKIDQGWDAEVNAPAVDTSIRWFVCPSHPDNYGQIQSALTKAGAEPGLTHYVGIAGIGKNAAELRDTERHCGMFGYDRQTKRSDVTGGISSTMMVAETAQQNGPWAAGGPATVRGLDPATRPYIGPGRSFGGMHPGGLNLLFVDGSVRFFADSTDSTVFEKLAVIRGDKGR